MPVFACTGTVSTIPTHSSGTGIVETVPVHADTGMVCGFLVAMYCYDTHSIWQATYTCTL